MNEIKQELAAIQERNARVEMDKAWETSWTRRIFIIAITYIFAVIYMKVAGLQNAYLGAAVPATGFLLSTLSIPFVRSIWQKLR